MLNLDHLLRHAPRTPDPEHRAEVLQRMHRAMEAAAAAYYDRLEEEAEALDGMGLQLIPVICQELDASRWPAKKQDGTLRHGKDGSPLPAFTGKNPSRWRGPDQPQLLSHSRPPSLQGLRDSIAVARRHGLPLGLGVIPSTTVVVIDFDAKDYGSAGELEADFLRLVEAHPELKLTRIERTPRGGLHLYVRVADGMASWSKGRGGHYCRFATEEGGPHRGEVLTGIRIAVTAPTNDAYLLTGDPDYGHQLVEVENLAAIGIRPHVKERQQQHAALPLSADPPRPIPAPQQAGMIDAPALGLLLGRKAREVLTGGHPYGEDRSTNYAGFLRELHGVENWLSAEGLPFTGTADQLKAQAVAALGIEDKADRVADTIEPSDCRALEPDKLRRRYEWLASGGHQQSSSTPPTGGQQQAADDRQREPGDPYRVGDCPPDLHAADLLHDGLSGHVASVAETLFRYDPATGCWEQWSDADATGEAQTVLRRMYRLKRQEGKPDRQVHQFGTIRNCRDAVASLKVKAGPGPLRDPSPPPVIVFTNGTYNLLTGQLERHSPEHGATYRIDAPYVPGATCPAPLQRVIEVCFPEGAEPIIRGLLRSVADPTIRYGEAFHLLGESGTGKGILLTFAGSLLPASLRSEVRHPADLDSPEKLHQFVLGRRLILFPDTPSRIQGAAHCGRFYELVENSPQTTRKLRAGEAERSRPMFARCLLASVKPLQFPDGRDGFLRRVRTLITLPRTGTPDPTLRADLVGSTEAHRRIRGEAVSWALAMPLEEVEAVLDGNDPEGLLRETAAEAAAASDTVSQWADECLIPHPLGPDREVDSETWAQMFEAYVGWCRYSGVQYAMQRSNFMGQLRTVLGPKRCLPRRKESRAEARAAGRTQRLNLRRFDAGFTLRPGVLRGRPEGTSLDGGINAGQVVPDRLSFDRLAIGAGGLEAIAATPQAAHPDLRPAADSPETTPPDSRETTTSGQKRGAGAGGSHRADSPETTPRTQGRTQGGLKPVSGQSESLRSTAGAEVLPSSPRWSQGSPQSIQQQKKEEAEAASSAPLISIRGGMDSESPETGPEGTFAAGDLVDMQAAKGWCTGYRVALVEEASTGPRIRVEEVEGDDYRVVSPAALRRTPGR